MSIELSSAVRSPSECRRALGDVGHLIEENWFTFSQSAVSLCESRGGHVSTPRCGKRSVPWSLLSLSVQMRGVGLKRQHKQVTHDAHVLNDVLRIAIVRARYVWLGQSRPPALQLAAFACALDSFSTSRTELRYSSSFCWSSRLMLRRKILRVRQHSV